MYIWDSMGDFTNRMIAVLSGLPEACMAGESGFRVGHIISPSFWYVSMRAVKTLPTIRNGWTSNEITLYSDVRILHIT